MSVAISFGAPRLEGYLTVEEVFPAIGVFDFGWRGRERFRDQLAGSVGYCNEQRKFYREDENTANPLIDSVVGATSSGETAN